MEIFFLFFKNKIWENLGKNIWFSATKKIAIFVKSETWENKTLCFTIYHIPGTSPYICIHESETFKDRFASFLGNGQLLMAFTCRQVRQCHLIIMPCIASIIVQNLQWESAIPGRFCTINVKPPIGLPTGPPWEPESPAHSLVSKYQLCKDYAHSCLAWMGDCSGCC